MRSATISKQFTFHAAHQLPNHDGPCRRLHGHSYVLEVLVSGPVKQATGEADEGMVLDFMVLKNVYQSWIEPYVEHQFLNDTLRRTDQAELPDIERSGDGEPLTTSENLARWIHAVFTQTLRDDWGRKDLLVCVRLWETPTSCAEVGKIWRE